MTALRERYLEAIGIPLWRLRTAAPVTVDAPSEPAPVVPPVPTAVPSAEPDAAWSALAAEVRGCTLCGLHRTRTQTVFGVGKRDASLFVIGEAPGADEDRRGEPFVGRAGQLLNAMLKAIGLPRSEVYIANILKCRPPNNRDPEPAEAGTCTPYLTRQIDLVKPRVLLAVGRIAAQWLLQTDTPIGRLRGRVTTYGERNTPLVVTYHPAYLLRSPLDKAKAWNDLCLVKELLSRSP
jgi:DNA polymerase